MAKEIPLSQGKVAIVDDEDYERLSAFKWYAARENRITGGELWVARRSYKSGGKKSTVRMHSEILLHLPGMQVDHINHDSLDNRRCNLRYVTASQNLANSRKRAGSISRYKGVLYRKSRGVWYAKIKVGGKDLYLGCGTEEECAEMFRVKHLEVYGANSFFAGGQHV